MQIQINEILLTYWTDKNLRSESKCGQEYEEKVHMYIAGGRITY